MRREVVVQVFNAEGVVDPFGTQKFLPEVEEEWYSFKVDDGDLYIYYGEEIYGLPDLIRIVKIFAEGRWAEVEYE